MGAEHDIQAVAELSRARGEPATSGCSDPHTYDLVERHSQQREQPASDSAAPAIAFDRR